RSEPRILTVAACEARVLAERLGVGGLELARDREPSSEELVTGLLGGHPEPEDDPLAPREALAPVVRVALELEPAAGVERDGAEGPGADGALLPARLRDVGALRHDGHRRIRQDGREEGDGLLEVEEELAGRHDVEPLEVRPLALEDRGGAAD